MSIIETDSRRVRAEDEAVEIRLSDIVQFLNDHRRRLLLGALAGLLIGALYAFTRPNVYTAQVTVMPEIQARGAGSLGNLGSLAGLAGISLDNLNAPDAIRPDLYPNVLQSVPFVLHLLKQPVYVGETRTTMPFQAFIDQLAARGIRGWFGGGSGSRNEAEERADPRNFSRAIQLTKEQNDYVEFVQTNVSSVYDKKTGIITITAILPDPVVAATVARLSLEYLTSYITTYRTEKARNQVSFLARQVQEAKGRYQSAEYALSAYRDRNRATYLNTAKIDEQRLQAEYLLTQSVYNELSKQFEQAKIKVQEETPVFKTLEPPTVPLRKSGPKRTLIMLGFAVAGVVLTGGVLLIQLIRRRHLTA